MKRSLSRLGKRSVAGGPGNPAALPRTAPRDSSLLRAFERISLLGSVKGSPREVAALALREFARTMGFRRAEIVRLDRSRLRRLASYGRVRMVLDHTGDPLRDCPFGRRLLRRRRAVVGAGETGRGGARRRICHVGWYGLSSLFGVPLRGPGRPLGLLLADRGGGPFDMDARELEAATALSGLIADVLGRALAREQEGRRHAGLLLLSQVGCTLGADEDLAILLPRVADSIRVATKGVGVVVALHDDKADEFEVGAISGPPGQYSRGYRFPARPHATALSPRAVRSGRPVVVADLRRSPEVCAYWPRSRAVLVIPIRSRGRILGTLRLEDARPRAFGEDDIRLCNTLADMIGHAVRKARVLEALNRRQADLRAVSESLERRIEEDRRRIARELHDELAQSMTAARINLALLRTLTRGGKADVRRAIRETEAVVLRTISETRRIAMDLRPSMLDDLGLVAALRWYADTFSRRTGVGVVIKANVNGGQGDKDVNMLLFRFFQEALTNVARHARAGRVRIGLSGSNGTVRAVVADDGIGFRPGGAHHQGLGLIGMRERIERAGGSLRVRSRPGGGTRLLAAVPLRPAGSGRRLRGSAARRVARREAWP